MGPDVERKLTEFLTDPEKEGVDVGALFREATEIATRGIRKCSTRNKSDTSNW